LSIEKEAQERLLQYRHPGDWRRHELGRAAPRLGKLGNDPVNHLSLLHTLPA
jgi:hypothetical protein